MNGLSYYRCRCLKPRRRLYLVKKVLYFCDEISGLCHKGLTEVFDRKEVPSTINRVGSMFTGFFNDGPVASLAQVEQSDVPGHARFFHGMLEGGVYLAPASYEAGFMSAAHTEADIQETLDVAERVFANLR